MDQQVIIDTDSNVFTIGNFNIHEHRLVFNDARFFEFGVFPLIIKHVHHVGAILNAEPVANDVFVLAVDSDWWHARIVGSFAYAN